MALTTPQVHKETFPYLLTAAQAAFDAGELDKARKYAAEAYGLDRTSEQASVLVGFISLALAGGDPFKIAKALSSNTNKDAASTTDALAPLKAVVGLNPSEFNQMGALEISDPALPVMVPKCVEDVRTNVKKLAYLNDAIFAVCPFVDASAHITADYRQNCELHRGERHERELANFLWAFSHLTEALAFNSVLTYGASTAGSKSNIELRVEKINSMSTSTTDPTQVAALLSAVQSINATLQAVLPTDGACSPTAPTSQLTATLNDMLAVDAAFASIPGTPPQVRASIQKVMGRIKAPQAVPTSGSSESSSQTELLKGDLTKNMSKGLAAKIDSLGADPSHPLSTDQKTSLCSTYASIAAGSGQSSSLCSAPAATAAP